MNHYIDITNEHCPMTFVKVKLKLEKIDKGDRLEILLREGEPLNNVPHSVEQQGYKVLSVDRTGNSLYKIIIEK